MNAKVIVAVVLVIVGLGAVGVGVFKYFQAQKPNSGLKVDTNPASLVFVDNVQVGQTPFDKMFKAGEVAIRLVPTTSGAALPAYQTKVRLTQKFYTVIRRDFGASDSESTGDIVSVEPQSGKVASLAVVVTGPDAAAVTVDGQSQGFSPIFITSLPTGEHQIAVAAPGFSERKITAQAIAGYKLTVQVKLASNQSITPTPTPTLEFDTTPTPTKKGAKTPPTPTPGKVTRVEIKDTPTGFLRVRAQPSTASKELGRVNPGEEYDVLDTQTNWYKIKVDLDDASEGWISAQYTKSI